MWLSTYVLRPYTRIFQLIKPLFSEKIQKKVVERYIKPLKQNGGLLEVFGQPPQRQENVVSNAHKGDKPVFVEDEKRPKGKS
jgi:hypothetical protein